jgi:hypothetical protein
MSYLASPDTNENTNGRTPRTVVAGHFREASPSGNLLVGYRVVR